MDQERNEAEKEFMEEIVDDLGYRPKGGRNQGPNSTVVQRSVPKFLISGAIGIVLLVLVISFFLMGRNGDNTEELASIQAGLKSLEDRMAGLNRLEERIAGLKRLEERLIRLEGQKGLKGLEGLEDRIIRLEKEEKNLQQAIRESVSRAATPSPKKPAPEVKQRYHTVRSGEGLYTIAKKYGISADKLCKLNKITPKTPIQPGQKLLVGE